MRRYFLQMTLPRSSTHLLLPLLLLLRLLLVFLQWRTSSSAIIMSLRNQRNTRHSRTPTLRANQTTCPIFSGTWVRDDSLPLYQYTCPFIDPEFNCQMYGRPDSGYLKYRWKPLDCELPRFSGVEFLERMRGKNVMFVGDSLGKNQWESLVCLIYADAPRTPTQMARGDPLSTLKFLDYGVTISFYKARYLVDIDVVQGRRVLRLDDISSNGNAWREADVLSFNTGHWWSHTGSLQEWDVMESGGTYYQDMDRGAAMERALRTWAKWVDANTDPTRTNLFFLAISPTHYNPAEWSAGATAITTTKNCYGETVPMSGTAYPGEYMEQMRVIDEVLKDMHNPAYLLDITMLSALRKDGHPSIYSGELSPGQRTHPDRYADCSHWCLPGLPDTWNQLFYTALLY